MPAIDLTTFLTTKGLSVIIFAPLGILGLLALLFIPSLLSSGAKARPAMDALTRYFLMAAGVLLMSLSALPTVQSVFSGITFAAETYVALLLVFATGGAIFLWQENALQSIDPASKEIPGLLYTSLFRLIGCLLSIVAALSLALAIVLRATGTGWWIDASVLLLFGLLLCACTQQREEKQGFFRKLPVVRGKRRK